MEELGPSRPPVESERDSDENPWAAFKVRRGVLRGRPPVVPEAQVQHPEDADSQATEPQT